MEESGLLGMLNVLNQTRRRVYNIMSLRHQENKVADLNK